MRNLVKRAFATAMTASFIFGACGCSFLKDAAPDEVLDAADAYAKLIADCNLSKMKKASDKDFDKKTEDWAELLDFSEGEDPFIVSDEDINIGISVNEGNTALKDAIDAYLSGKTPEDFNALMEEAIKIQPLSE